MEAPSPRSLEFMGRTARREDLENCRLRYMHGSATVNADQQGRMGNRPFMQAITARNGLKRPKA